MSENRVTSEKNAIWRAPEQPYTGPATNELGDKNSAKIIPVGPLAQVLFEYEAPENVGYRIARRAGLHIGTTALPFATVETVIHRTMEENGGMPNWDKVEDQLGKIVTHENRKTRRGV